MPDLESRGISRVLKIPFKNTSRTPFVTTELRHRTDSNGVSTRSSASIETEEYLAQISLIYIGKVP